MATTIETLAATRMEFEKLLDFSFDPAFASRSGLPWWPWVGSRFSLSPIRTMVIGESIYNWGEGFDVRYAKFDALRQTHSRHALNYRRDSPYVRNFERAIYQAYAPSEEQKLALWSSVAYHNLVLDPLKSLKARPSYSQYLEGWNELLELTHLMAVDQAIIYGLESKKIDALAEAAKRRGSILQRSPMQTKVGRSRPKLITIRDGDRAMKLLFIRHPSAFFSWRKWAPVIREHLSQF